MNVMLAVILRILPLVVVLLFSAGGNAQDGEEKPVVKPRYRPWSERRSTVENLHTGLRNQPDDRLYYFIQITPDKSLDDGRKEARRVMSEFRKIDKHIDQRG